MCHVWRHCFVVDTRKDIKVAISEGQLTISGKRSTMENVVDEEDQVVQAVCIDACVC